MCHFFCCNPAKQKHESWDLVGRRRTFSRNYSRQCSRNHIVLVGELVVGTLVGNAEGGSVGITVGNLVGEVVVGVLDANATA